MANDVINPYQTFRDNAGIALAGGSLRVLVNRTTTVGTAFSDSTLLIPQEVDPYDLDAYGRVRGDLRWLGERSVEVYDSNDGLVRTLNDVVTLVDTSGFAINEIDVASMVANTTLALGDVVETQSYSDTNKQGYGGARYLVVADATGTDDGYLFIDLPNTTPVLQAQLLDVEKNNNFYVAGAVGDGVADDSTPVQAVLDTGGDVDCSNGTFLVEGLTITQDTRIEGDGTLKLVSFASSDMFTLSGADKLIAFDGVTIDGNSDNQTAESARVCVKSTITASADTLSSVTFNNVTFQNGPQYDVEGEGDDTATGVVLYTFAECRFLGGLQSTDTPYLAAYASITEGASVLVEDCYFDLTESPSSTGGRAGVITSNSTFANPGYLSVSGSTFNRIGVSAAPASILAAIDAKGVQRVIIGGNRLLSPQGGGIVFGAEVDQVQIDGNLIDGLTGNDLVGGIGVVTTAEAAPGENWSISGNELIDVAGVGIIVDGSSAGIDASNLTIDGNIIDAPTSEAILVENINTLSIRDNIIGLDNATGIDAIKVDADGLAGTVTIEGNQIINVDGVAILADVACAGATFIIDGNQIDTATDGITVTSTTADAAFITNNILTELDGDLVTVGDLTDCVLDGNSYAGTTVPATYAQNTGSITNLVTGENLWEQYDTSITDLTGAAIAITSHYHELTDTTTITSATFAGDLIGFLVVLRATVNVTVNDSATINLTGVYAMTDTDTLTLAWDGTAFNEVSRSVN